MKYFRVVALIDMDCFYVQCHLADPENHKESFQTISRIFDGSRILEILLSSNFIPLKKSGFRSIIKFKGKPSIVVQRNFDKDKILAVSYEARELGIKRKGCSVNQAIEKARDKNVELQIFRVAEYRNGRPNLGRFSN